MSGGASVPFQGKASAKGSPSRRWPAGKPLPDIEQFVARDLLNETLREMGKKPSE